MTPEEFFNKKYTPELIDDLKINISLWELMDEYAEYKSKQYATYCVSQIPVEDAFFSIKPYKSWNNDK